MVGVLNGKKGKAVSVVVVAFLLCGVFGGLVVEQSLATFQFGYSRVGATGQSVNDWTLIVNWTLVVPDNYRLVVDDFLVYCGGNGSEGVEGAVYGSDLAVLWRTGYEVISAVGWKNCSGLGWSLLSGTYYLACFYNGTYYFDDYSGYTAYYDEGNSLPDPTSQASLGTWSNYKPSFYVEYHYESLTQASVVSLDASSVGQLALTLFLVAISVLLALKSRSWAVNFLFGLSLVGYLSWQFANAATESFGGWLEFMVLIGAVLVLVKGAVLVRASGV